MKLLLVVNPAASSVTPRSQVLIQRALGQRHTVEVAETTRRNHATRLAEDGAAQGVDGVVVLGGDGTLNEAANGLAGSDTALIPLPGGSTNVFARTLGLPDDPLEAVELSMAALDQGLIERVGLGRANGRHFLFHTGIGFDAAVVEQVERQSDLKRYLSHPLFVWAAVKTWIRHYDRKAPAFEVRIPTDQGEEVVPEGYFSVCLNTNPYTYLGSRPLDIAPEATLDRGLALVTIKSLRVDHILRLAGDALGGERGLAGSRYVDYRTDLSEVTLRSSKPFPLQLDGDFVGRVAEVRFEHVPAAMLLARTDRL